MSKKAGGSNKTEVDPHTRHKREAPHHPPKAARITTWATFHNRPLHWWCAKMEASPCKRDRATLTIQRTRDKGKGLRHKGLPSITKGD